MDKIEEKKFEIEISELFPNFDNHLKIENNSRIIFSGKFGIGKTYFLNEFFKNKQNEYDVFHLFPVNYQISSNENILEFLKYDILIELIQKDKDIFKNDDKTDIGMIENIKEYIKKDFNMNSFLKGTIDHIIDPIPKIGKTLGRPLKSILEFDKKFQEFKEGDKKIIADFLEKNNNETDCLSQILKSKIEQSKKDKQSVLILDDLERIDPAHIFRILNVFSAHFDLQNNELKNKFGFDKIILVADCKNLKSIFHHIYGRDTDYNGYFDKFYSIEIFEFNNEKIITNFVNEIISKFKTENSIELKEALQKRSFLRNFLSDILKSSLELQGKEKLNLRQLLKGTKSQLSHLNDYLDLNNDLEKDQQIIHIVNLSIKTLISIFGGLSDNLLDVLKKIKLKLETKNNYNDDPMYKTFSKYLLLKIKPESYYTKNLKTLYNDYTITWGEDIKDKRIVNVNNTKGTQSNTKSLFYDLLIDYVEKNHYL